MSSFSAELSTKSLITSGLYCKQTIQKDKIFWTFSGDEILVQPIVQQQNKKSPNN